MPEALEKAEYWWHAREVQQIYPDYKTSQVFFEWMKIFSLGRKRILDTYLAATYYSQGITDIVSSDARDFKVFGCFTTMETPQHFHLVKGAIREVLVFSPAGRAAVSFRLS